MIFESSLLDVQLTKNIISLSCFCQMFGVNKTQHELCSHQEFYQMDMHNLMTYNGQW